MADRRALTTPSFLYLGVELPLLLATDTIIVHPRRSVNRKRTDGQLYINICSDERRRYKEFNVTLFSHSRVKAGQGPGLSYARASGINSVAKLVGKNDKSYGPWAFVPSVFPLWGQ